MFDRQWPPPSYYTTFDPKDSQLGLSFRLRALDPKVVVAEDGRRFMRYQVPQTPVQPGSVRLDGSLYDVDGELFTFGQTPRLAGTIDYASGVLEVDIDVSPGIYSRIVVYSVAR